MRISSVVALVCVAASPAFADAVDDIKQKGELVVGVLGTDEPNSFVDPATRAYVGYEIDLATAVAKKLGVKPIFKQLSVAARIPELQQRHVDLLAASLTHIKDRESQVDFGLTHFVTGSRVVVTKKSGVAHVNELAGKKVLTVRGGTQEPNLLRAVPTANVVTFETTQQALQALQQGKGVAYVNDEASLQNDLLKLGARGADYVLLPENLNVESLAFGIRKGETRLKALVDETLRELETSGEADKLYEKWWGQGSKLKFGKRAFKFDSDRVSN